MTNISMSVVGNLSPVLFLTFRSLYDISYSLLGLLVLINFVTQLSIDLVFSFFSHKFNIPKTVKITPALSVIGLIVYSLAPVIFPNAVYLGLLLGTVIFSASSGLAEVLISPVIAAIPAENPDREMSKLHSIYAWGVVFVVVFATLFLLLFDNTSWQWLGFIFTLIPLTACVLFSGSEIPKMETPERVSGVLEIMKDKRLWLSVVAIFLGGAAECTMAQWASGYIEKALGIEKVWGDIFGVALFAMMLGLGRTMYANKGKNIGSVLFFGAIGAAVCYFIAAVSNVPIVGLLACGLTGFCVSMLWPGNLIVATDRLPNTGVFMFAMMAAGGDLGASVGPQLVGVVTDVAMASGWGVELAATLSMSVEALGMKLGMLVGMIFPLIAIFIYYVFYKEERKKKAKEQEEQLKGEDN
jgi:fucose permease